MTKTITFAIPAYNAEPYIEKCLSSFLEESVLERIQVLIINDGSSDGTIKIARRYVERYPETFNLINQENRGHGGALNTAILLATGKYFKAVDADDWVDTGSLFPYVSTLDTTEADVVINSYHTVNIYSRKSILYSAECSKTGRVISVEELMEVYNQIATCCSFHGITYKTETYRKIQYKLSEKIFYEDNEYAIIPFCRVESVLILPFSLYEYQIGNNEQSVAFHNQVKHIGHIEHVILQILEQRKTVVLTQSQEEYYLRKLAVLVASYYALALVKNPEKKSGRADAKRFYRLMKGKEPKLIKRTNRKYLTLLLMNKLKISRGLYQKLTNSHLYKQVRKWWIQ